MRGDDLPLRPCREPAAVHAVGRAGQAGRTGRRRVGRGVSRDGPARCAVRLADIALPHRHPGLRPGRVFHRASLGGASGGSGVASGRARRHRAEATAPLQRFMLGTPPTGATDQPRDQRRYGCGALWTRDPGRGDAAPPCRWGNAMAHAAPDNSGRGDAADDARGPSRLSPLSPLSQALPSGSGLRGHHALPAEVLGHTEPCRAAIPVDRWPAARRGHTTEIDVARSLARTRNGKESGALFRRTDALRPSNRQQPSLVRAPLSYC